MTASNRNLAWSAAVLQIVFVAALSGAEDAAKEVKKISPEATASREAAQRELAEFNSLIGGWRGVGQPVRNSTKGSWTETAEWIWDLKSERVAIRFSVKDGKQLLAARLCWDAENKEFEFLATTPDKTERAYRGARAGNKLTLETSPSDTGEIHQIVVTQLNEKRTLMLFQSKSKTQQQFNRVAEVGYTREGPKLAEEGIDGPECIVTGGKGTMKTEYKGKTYWFCCTGCRDAFQDDPDGVIAQAAERAAKKKNAGKSNSKETKAVSPEK